MRLLFSPNGSTLGLEGTSASKQESDGLERMPGCNGTNWSFHRISPADFHGKRRTISLSFAELGSCVAGSRAIIAFDFAR